MKTKKSNINGQTGLVVINEEGGGVPRGKEARHIDVNNQA